MTIQGAIAELQNMLKVDDIPFYYKSGIQKVIETLQMDAQPNRGEWIPCEEKLPQMGETVLCTNKHGSVFSSALTFISSWGCFCFGQHRGVIAWMPLPEPYQTERSEDETQDRDST